MQELDRQVKKVAYQALGFSFFVALMAMAVPFNMLMIFMWAIPSESIGNIFTIATVAMAGLLFMAAFDILRFALLRRFAVHLNQELGEKILVGMFKNAAELAKGEAANAMSDLQKIRRFLSSPTSGALLDAMLTPLIILIIYLISPLMGILAIAAILLILAISLLNHKPTQERLRQANTTFNRANNFAQDCVYNAQSAKAMGMQGTLRRRWRQLQDGMIADQTEASERGGIMSATTKTLGMVMQAMLFGAGTYLMISAGLHAGLVLVAVILAGRVVQPLQGVVNGWNQYQEARDAYQRLKEFFASQQQEGEHLDLPAPRGGIKAENLTFAHGRKAVIAGVTFAQEPGTVLGVIGPSGAGKSTLARLLTGVWRPVNGILRLDGADMHQWDQDLLGPHIGYLPQDVELFSGTVAENICRFREVDREAARRTAEFVGINELLEQLPDGYDTVLEEHGRNLPGGLRQRIGLARALYGDPKLVILDEPDASLDHQGIEALNRIIKELRDRGTSVVLITHRTSLLGLTDQLLMLAQGKSVAYGPTAEVLRKLQGGSGTAQPAAVPPNTGGPAPALSGTA